MCTGGGEGFRDGIFPMVDSVVDFADYDGDEDGVVDGFFFIVLKAAPWPCFSFVSSRLGFRWR